MITYLVATCPRCHGDLSFDDVSDGYFAQCPNCDEDFYEWETEK